MDILVRVDGAYIYHPDHLVTKELITTEPKNFHSKRADIKIWYVIFSIITIVGIALSFLVHFTLFTLCLPALIITPRFITRDRELKRKISQRWDAIENRFATSPGDHLYAEFQGIGKALAAFDRATSSLRDKADTYLPNIDVVHREAWELVGKGYDLSKILGLYAGERTARLTENVQKARTEYESEVRRFVNVCLQSVELAGSVMASETISGRGIFLDQLEQTLERKSMVMKELESGD